jgi:hypothetical protein
MLVIPLNYQHPGATLSGTTDLGGGTNKDFLGPRTGEFIIASR